MRGENYTEAELKDVCVSIVTCYDAYDLAFIEFETTNYLGIRVTRHDFTEGFVIINKKYIVSVSVVYQGDIVFTKDNEFDDPSYL